ncbi:MAG: response regulator [Candidatus Kapaibacteriales bacterium]
MNKHKLLVIDDEENLLSDLKLILELKGYLVNTASNATDGIQKAIQKLPDLIVCDITLRDSDGYHVLSTLKENPITASIPFLFLSAKSSKEDIRKGMNLGADDYISKPFEVNVLASTIASLIEKSQHSDIQNEKVLDEIRDILSRTLPHEIRTPLNSILSYSKHLIKNDSEIKSSDRLEMLEGIYSDAQRLNRMFENYIKYSRVSAISKSKTERDIYRKKKCDYPELILTDLAKLSTSKTNSKYDINLPKKANPIAVDSEHFTYLAHELIDNAVKFSKTDNNIRISGNLVDNEFVLTVSNHGWPLDSEKLSKVKPFSQFDRRQYEQQGTGMGLAIVKKIVEIYSGSLGSQVDSENWTSVTVTLPLAK